MKVSCRSSSSLFCHKAFHLMTIIWAKIAKKKQGNSHQNSLQHSFADFARAEKVYDTDNNVTFPACLFPRYAVHVCTFSFSHQMSPRTDNSNISDDVLNLSTLVSWGLMFQLADLRFLVVQFLNRWRNHKKFQDTSIRIQSWLHTESMQINLQNYELSRINQSGSQGYDYISFSGHNSWNLINVEESFGI